MPIVIPRTNSMLLPFIEELSEREGEHREIEQQNLERETGYKIIRKDQLLRKEDRGANDERPIVLTRPNGSVSGLTRSTIELGSSLIFIWWLRSLFFFFKRRYYFSYFWNMIIMYVCVCVNNNSESALIYWHVYWNQLIIWKY